MSDSTYSATAFPVSPDSTSWLISAAEAARLCGRSRASWWRDLAAGRIPTPVKVGNSTLWRRGELLAWINAGCPDQKRWQALQAHRKS